VGRGQRAGPRGSLAQGAAWGLKCPRRSGAHKAQAQQLEEPPQQQVAAVSAAASARGVDRFRLTPPWKVLLKKWPW